jgi:hypothetical protein
MIAKNVEGSRPDAADHQVFGLSPSDKGSAVLHGRCRADLALDPHFGWAFGVFSGHPRTKLMKFRVATLNLEQDHKRWEARKPLITAEIAALKPDFIAFNEVSIPLQTAKSLQEAAAEMPVLRYNLVQQTRANGLSRVEAEALLTRFPIIEAGNFDFQTRDIEALVARLVIGNLPIDVCDTSLHVARG